jgi:Mg2+ and Co2+ transporter CorA
MAARWVDLVDPTREELLSVLPARVDPEVVETLLAQPDPARGARPLLEAHGPYAFGVFTAIRAHDDGSDEALEIDLVATPSVVVTVRKSPPGGEPYDTSALHPAHESDAAAGLLVHRLVDDIADSYFGLLESVYSAIDTLEDEIDDLEPRQVRRRILELRHRLLHYRKVVSATRGAVRRVLDGRVEVGDHELFPTEIEKLFGDTYDTLVRATEELDIARDLLAGARDHLQAKIAETQNEVGKKLTVIASLVLVPSLIVGFYGQNFEGVFQREYWTLGVSVGLILASTIVQLALFRWRRWI